MLTVAAGLPRRTSLITVAALIALVLAGAGAHPAAASHYTGGHLAALNGHGQPTIWFVDRTDSSWPVNASAVEWDRTSSVTMGRRAECPHPGDYCIPVHQVSSLPNGNLGLSTLFVNSEPTHVSRSGNPNVQLSNQTSVSRRRSVACHELGHWFILNHRAPSDSCMRNDSVFPNLPDGHDFNQISIAYGHSH